MASLHSCEALFPPHLQQHMQPPHGYPMTQQPSIPATLLPEHHPHFQQQFAHQRFPGPAPQAGVPATMLPEQQMHHFNAAQLCPSEAARGPSNHAASRPQRPAICTNATTPATETSGPAAADYPGNPASRAVTHASCNAHAWTMPRPAPARTAASLPRPSSPGDLKAGGAAARAAPAKPRLHSDIPAPSTRRAGTPNTASELSATSADAGRLVAQAQLCCLLVSDPVCSELRRALRTLIDVVYLIRDLDHQLMLSGDLNRDTVITSEHPRGQNAKIDKTGPTLWRSPRPQSQLQLLLVCPSCLVFSCSHSGCQNPPTYIVA